MDINSKDFQIPDHSIVQLKEMKICQKIYLQEQERIKKEEQEAFRSDLKSILPEVHVTPGTANCKDIKQVEFNREYRDILMYSQWMTEEPCDLEDFILIPCPKGSRISCTRKEDSKVCELFHKDGHKFMNVTINIPPDTQLDCIYSKRNKTIYILDAMRYDGQPYVDLDTAFRRYWIGSKFYERRLAITDKGTDFKLAFIDGYDFTQPQKVQEVFKRLPMFTDGAELDGFLFYNKNATYTPGESKNCLWLFPYMIDEVLAMFRVNVNYNSLKPDKYVNYLDHIEKHNEKMNKKKRYKDRAERGVDTRDNLTVDYRQCNFYSFEDVKNRADERKKINELERFGGLVGVGGVNRGEKMDFSQKPDDTEMKFDEDDEFNGAWGGFKGVKRRGGNKNVNDKSQRSDGKNFNRGSNRNDGNRTNFSQVSSNRPNFNQAPRNFNYREDSNNSEDQFANGWFSAGNSSSNNNNRGGNNNNFNGNWNQNRNFQITDDDMHQFFDDVTHNLNNFNGNQGFDDYDRGNCGGGPRRGGQGGKFMRKRF